MKRLIATDVAPYLDRWERERDLPKDLFRSFGAAGVLGLVVPKQFGGSGLDLTYSMIVMEELMAAKAMSVAVSLMLQSNTVCPLLVKYGSPDLRARFLAPIARGELVASLAVTEPTGGSDLMRAIRCWAEPDGDHWIITGEKKFITNGPIADVVFVLARTSKEDGPFSTTMIAVPASTPGFEVVARLEKLGLHASPTGWLRFNACRVPRRNTVGRPSLGYVQTSDVLHPERLLIGVGANALAMACLEDTIAYLRAPRGRPRRAAAEAHRYEIASMAACLHAGRAFAWAVAARLAAGDPDAVTGCMIAKFALSEAAQRAIQYCAGLHGEFGLREGTWMERALRDARVLSVFAGTSEVMRDLVGAQLVAASSGKDVGGAPRQL